MKKVISVVGARPNFMKVAPLHRAFQKYNDQVQHLICHTGQHYDVNMSKVFFEELELPKPDFYLGVGSGSHAEQTAKIMIEFEKVLLKEKPNLVIVVGDVNSTVACSLVAVKLGIKVAHVEAGLRSFDRTMPEEINRLLTDSIADYLFITEVSGVQNLSNEGIDEGKVFFVGNCMIDSLINYLPKIDRSKILTEMSLASREYIVVTLHRPSNVDDPSNIKEIFSQFSSLAENYKIVFPIHPRTRKNLEHAGLTDIHKNILLIDPIGYIDFVNLVKNSALVLTDSGGIQEETTYLKIPCLTLRDNTERPITTTLGTNKLIGTNYNKIYDEAHSRLNKKQTDSSIPPLWDGKAGERIAEILVKNLN
ncbi:MAG: UDP-N-acetylglucosamine 2-epimerase (non-hydrolyzing) [Ignavibacteria bacterium]|nr:UDP-N-acetylglucosamine 2-epimerase (non-hydrolyzing) [Ignavibacteria bacterium]